MKSKTMRINSGSAKKSALVYLILIAFIFVILVFSIWFCFEKIKKSSLDVVAAIGGIKSSEIQAAQIKDFQSKYGDYVANLQKIDRSIVDPQNPLDFIEFLEDSALEESVDLNIYPISFPKVSGAKIASVQLSVEGSFINMINFLEKIENSYYLISMQDLTLESARSTSKSELENIRASVSMDILVK